MATPAALRALRDDIAAARAACERAALTGDGDRSRAEAEFALARLIHRYVHAAPFEDDPRAQRSAQWQATLARLRDIADTPLIDWLVLQVEVARNLARGVQDMRPRKDGPTWLVVLEHVANRKRKAKAVLAWMIASDRHGGATATSRTLPEPLRALHAASSTLKREP